MDEWLVIIDHCKWAQRPSVIQLSPLLRAPSPPKGYMKCTLVCSCFYTSNIAHHNLFTLLFSNRNTQPSVIVILLINVRTQNYFLSTGQLSDVIRHQKLLQISLQCAILISLPQCLKSWLIFCLNCKAQRTLTHCTKSGRCWKQCLCESIDEFPECSSGALLENNSHTNCQSCSTYRRKVTVYLYSCWK